MLGNRNLEGRFSQVSLFIETGIKVVINEFLVYKNETILSIVVTLCFMFKVYKKLLANILCGSKIEQG